MGYPPQYSWASLVPQTVKNLPQCERPGFNPLVGKIPCKRAWQPTPVFLPGEIPKDKGTWQATSFLTKLCPAAPWLLWRGAACYLPRSQCFLLRKPSCGLGREVREQLSPHRSPGELCPFFSSQVIPQPLWYLFRSFVIVKRTYSIKQAIWTSFSFFCHIWDCQTGFLIFVGCCFGLAAWILVPLPGVEPGPLALKAQSLNHWTTREVPAPPNHF